MNTQTNKHEFRATSYVSYENSFGMIRNEWDCELQVTIGFSLDNSGGYFEIYDVETGGEKWYAEGCLDIDGKDVIGYDGIFSLPWFITDKLKELGFNTEDVEC